MFSPFPDPSLIEETSYPGSLSKVVRFGAFSSAFFNLFFAFFYGLSGYPGFMVWVCAGGFLIALSCLLLQKSPRRHWLAAQAVTFSIYFTMFPIVLITGGINSSSILWMVFIPIAATVMSGTGGGLLWGAICILSVVSVYMLGEVFGMDYTLVSPTSTDRLVDLLAISLSALVASQYSEIKKFQVIQQLQSIRQNLQHLAIVDPLTNAYNRRYFFNHAQVELSRAGFNGQSNAIVLIDVDHFKNINDEHGHIIGDQVLMRLAAVCQENLRGNDLLARFGGEEFIILLPQTGLEEARQIANRLRDVIDRKKILTDKGRLPVTVSIGVAVSGPGEVMDLYELVIRADQAMYRAKSAGRNRVVLSDN